MSGSIRERSPGVFELRVFIGRDPVTGRVRHKSRTYRGGKRGARAALDELVAEVRGATVSSEGTFGYLLDRWLELVDEQRSPTTAYGYRRIVERDLRPALGEIPLNRLGPADLDALYLRLGSADGRGRAGGGLSPAAVRQVHAVARRACAQAVRWGWLATNPAANASPPPARRTKVSPPAVADLVRIVELADATDPDLGVLFRVAGALGGRRGELVGLRWSAVDLERGSVLVSGAVVEVAGRAVAKGTKTHAVRRIALDGETVARLRAHHAAMLERAELCGVELATDAFVFSREPDGLEPLPPGAVSKAFARIARELELDPRPRLHDLRHLHATQLLAAGVPIHTVAARLGHAQVSTTLNIYGHELPGSDTAAADLFGELYSAGKASVTELAGSSSTRRSGPDRPNLELVADLEVEHGLEPGPGRDDDPPPASR